MDIKESIKEHYDKNSTAESWTAKGRVRDAMDLYGEHSQNRALFDGVPIGPLVLDLACGTGHYGRVSTEYGAQKVIFADISSNMLAKARDLCGAGNMFDFVQADAENLPFKDDTFDTIVNVGLFEHLPETENVINELRRVLKPGGYLIIRFTNGRSLPGLYVRVKSVIKRKPPYGYPFYRMYSLPEAVSLHKKSFTLHKTSSSLLFPLPVIPGSIIRLFKKTSGNFLNKAFFGLCDKIERCLCRIRFILFFSVCFVVVFRKSENENK